MKKKNLATGVLAATLVLVLTLQPAYAQASEVFAKTPTDTVSALLVLTLLPLWVIVGKFVKKEIE